MYRWPSFKDVAEKCQTVEIAAAATFCNSIYLLFPVFVSVAILVQTKSRSMGAYLVELLAIATDL